MTVQPIQDIDDETLDRLANAHTRTIDALAGFEKMVEEAEPEFRAVAEDFRELHARHADTFAAILTAGGRAPDEDGSFMSSINVLVVSARAFFDRIDADVMKQIRNGEAHVLEAYRAAEQGSSSHELEKEVGTMRRELEALLDTAPPSTA